MSLKLKKNSTCRRSFNGMPDDQTVAEAVDIMSRGIGSRMGVTLDRLSKNKIVYRFVNPNVFSDVSLAHDLKDQSLSIHYWYTPRSGKQLVANMLALAEAFKCHSVLSVFGETGVYSFARYGFLPYQDEWDHLRHVVSKFVEEKRSHKKDVILEILKSANPRAMWDFVDLRHNADSRYGPALELLQGSGVLWKGYFNLDDPRQMNRARAYITPAIFDMTFSCDESPAYGLAKALLPSHI